MHSLFEHFTREAQIWVWGVWDSEIETVRRRRNFGLDLFQVLNHNVPKSLSMDVSISFARKKRYLDVENSPTGR